ALARRDAPSGRVRGGRDARPPHRPRRHARGLRHVLDPRARVAHRGGGSPRTDRRTARRPGARTGAPGRVLAPRGVVAPGMPRGPRRSGALAPVGTGLLVERVLDVVARLLEVGLGLVTLALGLEP